MAKQNFVSGGFYGKVGEFVGQRWKNIRTIRAYVIPHNPRTPLQQANRKFFGSAVPLAQIANSAYPKCPAFDTSTNTQWAYRMSQAKLAIEEGKLDVETIPIFPKNFTPPFSVTAVSVTEVLNTRQISLEIQGNLPDKGRDYSALLYFADGSREGTMLVCSGKSTDAVPNKILLECGDTLEIDSAQIFCRVFTNNDVKIETIVGCPRLELVKDLTKDFNTATDLESFVVNDDGTITAIYKTPNAWEAGLSGSVSASVGLTSCNRTFKDGTSSTATANVFDVVASFENVGGSVGVKCTVTPKSGQQTCLSYVAQGNINISYNNVSTPSTTPSTASVAQEFKPSWNNTQPTFKKDFVLDSKTADENGDIVAYFKSSNAWENSLAGAFQAALTLTSASRVLKNGTTLTSIAGVFTGVSTVENIGGFIGIKLALTAAEDKKTCVSYNVLGDVSISLANVYTDSTKPLTDSVSLSFSQTWSNSQPRFALSSSFIQSQGDELYAFSIIDGEVDGYYTLGFQTNPTTSNDKAFQKSKIGIEIDNWAQTNRDGTWVIRMNMVSGGISVTDNLTEDGIDEYHAPTSETEKVPISIAWSAPSFEDSRIAEGDEVASFTKVSNPTPGIITVKCKDFYTNDTLPATADYTFNMNSSVTFQNWETE